MPKTISYTERAKEKRFRKLSLEPKTLAMLLQYFDAMNELYNYIPAEKMLEIINSQNEEQISYEDFYDLTECFQDGKYHYYFMLQDELSDDAQNPDELYFVHESIAMLDDIYLEITQSHAGLSYYIPEKDELLKYADDHYFMEIPEADAVRTFFMEEMGMKRTRADELLDEAGTLITNNGDVEAVLKDFARMQVAFTEEQVAAFVPLLQKLINNTRTPYLCGHTPKEAGRIRPMLDDPSALYRKMEEHAAMFSHFRSRLPIMPDMMKKPSKNGPCPCGSGKKYKRCCGK